MNEFLYAWCANLMCINPSGATSASDINTTDIINSISTGVIAVFTVAMFFLTRAINKSNSSHNKVIKELYEGLVQAMISSKLPGNSDISYGDYKKVKELWGDDAMSNKDDKKDE